MISVVPALNESQTIGSVVEFARRHPLVTEVIVVGDGSIDGTPDLARQAGAAVVTSSLLGKGASMEDGLKAANNEVILYLDGDVRDLPDDLVQRMCDPILAGDADFVKAAFTRARGRVTTLTARPLLRIFFPELAHFEQPLGGIIAVRKALLEKLRFETDYGVDIGLLIDASVLGARIAEVFIGHIEHDSQPLEALGDMAMQVVRVILDRASSYKRLNPKYLSEILEVERRKQAELATIEKKLGRPTSLALIDMDGVLVRDRFVVRLAEATGQSQNLADLLDRFDMDPEERIRHIGKLFTGVSQDTFLAVAQTLELTPGAVEAVISLRQKGFRVGVVTDSFFIASEVIRRRIFADFSVAHVMRFQRGKASGKVTIAPAFLHPHGCALHRCCKANVLQHLIDRINVSRDHVLAIGDNINDLCLLRAAGMSVAFEPKARVVADAAQYVAHSNLLDAVKILNGTLGP